jgi:hypothetical protein
MTTMTFEEFCATGRDVEDVSGVAGDEDVRAGRVYDGDVFIESSGGHPDGRWMLTLESEGSLSDDLTELERRLYEYALE